MQHLDVNFGVIWRFELSFFICLFMCFFSQEIWADLSGSMATLPPTPQLAHATIRISCNAII